MSQQILNRGELFSVKENNVQYIIMNDKLWFLKTIYLCVLKLRPRATRSKLLNMLVYTRITTGYRSLELFNSIFKTMQLANLDGFITNNIKDNICKYTQESKDQS